MTWRSALAFWVLASFAAWMLVTGMVVSVGTGDVDQIARQNEADAVSMMPATGPE